MRKWRSRRNEALQWGLSDSWLELELDYSAATGSVRVWTRVSLFGSKDKGMVRSDAPRVAFLVGEVE